MARPSVRNTRNYWLPSKNTIMCPRPVEIKPGLPTARPTPAGRLGGDQSLSSTLRELSPYLIVWKRIWHIAWSFRGNDGHTVGPSVISAYDSSGLVMESPPRNNFLYNHFARRHRPLSLRIERPEWPTRHRKACDDPTTLFQLRRTTEYSAGFRGRGRRLRERELRSDDVVRKIGPSRTRRRPLASTSSW